jgi:hypothetical protein
MGVSDGVGPLTKSLKLAEGWEAVGFKCADYRPERMSGYHAREVLVIVTEATGVVDQLLWDAIDGLMSCEHPRLLVVGNPIENACQFAHSFDSPQWSKFFFSCWQSPNVLTAKWGKKNRKGKMREMTEADLARGMDPDALLEPGHNLPQYPGMCAWDWPWEMLQELGSASPKYITRVKGQFSEAAEDKPIDKATLRLCQTMEFEVEGAEGLLHVLSIDPADSGLDSTGYCYRIGPEVIDIWARQGDDTGQTANKVAYAIRNQGMRVDVIVVDCDGVGVGVYNRLKEFQDADEIPAEIKLVKIHSSGKPYREKNTEKFFDRRTEMWGETAEQMRAGEIGLSRVKNMEFERQVTAPNWKLVNGKQKLEKKEETKKRLGDSPDMGDAFVYAFCDWSKGVQELTWV